MQDSQHGQLDEQVAGELKRLITKFRIRIGSLPVRNTHSSSSEPLTSKQSYKTNKMSLDHPRCSRLRFSVGQSVYKEFASFVSILLADFVFFAQRVCFKFPSTALPLPLALPIIYHLFTCSTSSTYYPPSFSTFTSTYTSTFFLWFLLFFFCVCWNKYCEPDYHVASLIWIFGICRPGHGACTCCRWNISYCTIGEDHCKQCCSSCHHNLDARVENVNKIRYIKLDSKCHSTFELRVTNNRGVLKNCWKNAWQISHHSRRWILALHKKQKPHNCFFALRLPRIARILTVQVKSDKITPRRYKGYYRWRQWEGKILVQTCLASM